MIGTPLTGLPAASVTVTCSGDGNTVKTKALCDALPLGRNRRWRSGGDMEDTAGGRRCSCSASLQLIRACLGDAQTGERRQTVGIRILSGITREQVLCL